MPVLKIVNGTRHRIKAAVRQLLTENLRRGGRRFFIRRTVKHERCRRGPILHGIFLPGGRSSIAQLRAERHHSSEPAVCRSEERRVGKECRSRWARDE